MTEQINADVVIVGSGVVGSLSAYRLAQAGAKVVILEAGGEIKRSDAVRRWQQSTDKGANSPYPAAPHAPQPSDNDPASWYVNVGPVAAIPEIVTLAKCFADHQDVAKENGCVEAEPPDRLQGDFRRQFGCLNHLQKTVLFLESPVFRKNATCLPHQPDRRVIHRTTVQRPYKPLTIAYSSHRTNFSWMTPRSFRPFGTPAGHAERL